MSTIRKLSLVLLTAILFAFAAPVLGASADSVYLTVIRYDGMDGTNLYAPCYASYGIKVEGAPEDAEITYRWQVNVIGIIGSHEWLEASDCTWTWDYFSPVITIHVNEGYHNSTPPNRFCLRCLVKVDGKEYASPVFEIVTREPHDFESIDVVDLTVPSVGALPVQTARFTSTHLTAGSMVWCSVNSDGTYSKMKSGQRFESGKTYAAEIFATLEESWFFRPGVTKATVNGTPAYVCNAQNSSRMISVAAEFYLDGTKCVPLAYTDNLESLLQFRYSEMEPTPEESETEETSIGLKSGQSFTFKFPYAPLETGMAGKGYAVYALWKLEENGTTITTGSGTSATYSGWVAGKDYTLTAMLVLSKDNKLVIPTVTKEYKFHISVTSGDVVPVIRRQSPKTVEYRDGDTVRLYCFAVGGNLKYTWYRYGLQHSRYGDPYYTWRAYYSPDNNWIDIYADADDDQTVYKCVVKNSAGSVESRHFTLSRISHPLDQLTLSSGPLSENGKSSSLSLYWPEAGFESVQGELFVANSTAADTASDYMTFISNVTKQHPGSSIQSGKTYYVGLSITAAEGYTLSQSFSATLNLKQAKILSLDQTTAYCVLKVDPSSSGSLPLGDVDGNGFVNAKDYTMVKRYVLKTATLNEGQLARSNVNGDQVVNFKDYSIIKRIVLKTYVP